MRVTMILPALTEATSPLFRPIKYSLFPPLGLATLAGYLDPDDEVTLLDEHVERVDIESLACGLFAPVRGTSHQCEQPARGGTGVARFSRPRGRR